MRLIKRIFYWVVGLSAWGLVLPDVYAQVICPKVIMVQVDGCAIPQEKESEYFQFRTGTSAFNLNSNLSISTIAGTRNGWKAVPAIVAALNARVGTCSDGLPIFVNPYAAPYNGTIPSNSMVLAFIDQNPISTTSNLRDLCGSGLIFVIAGNASNPLPMFANKDECTTDCNRTITIAIGNCNYIVNYNPFRLDDFNGAYISIFEDGTVEYESANGCRPVGEPCAPLKNDLTSNQTTICPGFSHVLEPFADPPSPNASYFTLPNRGGTAYPIGTEVFDSITLYANAWNACQPQNVLQFVFKVNIIQGPQIDNSLSRIESTCGYFILPPITGTSLTGAQRYYTGRSGTGPNLRPGDTIRTNTILYAYDRQVASGCDDEEELEIRFVSAPVINNPKDTIVPCGVSFQLPPFNGINLSGNTAYYTGSKKTSPAIPPSSFITTGGIYYAFDELGQCFDEDTFNISLISNIIIPKDIIYPDTFCTEYTLPNINGLKVNYNTRLDGLGLSFMPNDTIITSYKLYIKASNLGCSVTDSVMYTRQWVFINPIFIDQPCKPVLDTLPRIQGNFLTNQVAYYSERGGKGKRYLPGDSVHAVKRGVFYQSEVLYAYDSVQYRSGKCVSEIPVIIPFFTIVELENIQDTTLGCGETFLIPAVKPALFSSAVYTLPNKQGIKLVTGTPVTANGTYYAYGEFSRCHDEDTFRITLVNNATLPRDTIRSDTFCTTFILPGLPGVVLSYNTQLNGLDTAYLPGDTLTKTTKLYIRANKSGCDILDSVTYTQRGIQINNITIEQPCTPVLDSLPGIVGSFLTSQVAYWSEMGGKGKRYLPGDSVHATKRNVLYDSRILYAYDGIQYSSGKCMSEVMVTIPFSTIVEMEPLQDTILACGQVFKVPALQPENFFTSAVYAQSNKEGIRSPAGAEITTSGTYYVYGELMRCYDEDTFNITFDRGPGYQNNADLSACNEVSLPEVNGTAFLSDSALYFTGPFGQGIRYVPGNTITQSQTLFIFDVSQPACLTQDTVLVRVSQRPELIIPIYYEGCDSIRLGQDQDFPNLLYYAQPGRIGQAYLPQTWITNTRTLYAFAGDPGCFDEDTISIIVRPTPQIARIRDTTVCNEFLLPLIRGQNLTGDQHYHALPGDQGQDFYGGMHYVTSTSVYYVWNNNSFCFDEDTLNITIIPRPAIDSLSPVNVCEEYILPAPTGNNLSGVSYFAAPGGQGVEYPVGSTVNQSITLFAFQDAPVCPAQRALQIAISDSTSSAFTLSAGEICAGDLLQLRHSGKGRMPNYSWTIVKDPLSNQPSQLANMANHDLALDTGLYTIRLRAVSGRCDGPETSQSVNVIPALPPISRLVCAPEADRIVFTWDQVPGATDYQVQMITGPTGIRSPYQMIFGGLTLGQLVGIQVTPLGDIACANGQSAALTCATRFCDNVRITIVDEPSFCSGDGPIVPIILITRDLTDTIPYQKSLTGPGIVDGVFYPSVAGPGDHIIRYTMTRDSCSFMDTVVYRVGSGSVLILNEDAVECAPQNQQQFNIRMRIQTDNKPYRVYYSYEGNSSSVFQSSADNFTLSALYGLIGDSITIDSVLDAADCRMQIASNAGTRTFRAVRFIAAVDTSSVCDFTRRTYQYRITLRNTNVNDPIRILSGGGQIIDSIYISPQVPFGQSHQVRISHFNACDTLSFNFNIACSCESVRDTFRTTACQTETITIRGKNYTINQSTGTDTIPSSIPGFCDTLRRIEIRFLIDPQLNLRPTICPGDSLAVAGMVFTQSMPSGIIRLANQAANGCDSVISVVLDFYAPIVRVIRDTICAGDTLILSGIGFYLNHTRDSIRFLNQSVNGCDSLVYFIIQVENLAVNFSLESSGCSIINSKSILISNIIGGSAPYTYRIGNGNLNAIGSLPLRLSQFTSDTFDLVIRSRQGCQQRLPIRFSPLNANLNVDLGSDTTITIGGQIPITIQTNFSPSSIRWLTQNNLSCLNCVNPIATPVTSSLYIVEVLDINGCAKRDTLWIFVDPEVMIFVPNLIRTISTDDRNRALVLFPSVEVQSISRFTLFDRWGTMVVDLTNLGAGGQAIPVWDGRFKGIDAPNAVYIYKLVYTTLDGRSKFKYGDVTVVR